VTCAYVTRTWWTGTSECWQPVCRYALCMCCTVLHCVRAILYGTALFMSCKRNVNSLPSSSFPSLSSIYLSSPFSLSSFSPVPHPSPHLPQDTSVLVRKHALILLTQLLLQDYIKWRGLLLFRFLATAVGKYVRDLIKLDLT
jgi:hypothetical protein